MDTVRVNIAYRPLRICWAIKQGDFAAFRTAVRTNHALWGGRFNPIVVVDRAREPLINSHSAPLQTAFADDYGGLSAARAF